jgi:sodium/bile acid cotransporter 3/5
MSPGETARYSSPHPPPRQPDGLEDRYSLLLRNQEQGIALLSSGGELQDEEGLLQLAVPSSRDWTIAVNVTGTFLGFSSVTARVAREGRGVQEEVGAAGDLQLTVTRSKAKKTASKIFGYSVAVLISLAYINFGCALDLGVMKEVLRRPVGPAIGFLSQFLFMPLCAFLLGYVFPSSSPEMRLGLFVTGTSPGGGASNIWTVMFGGNLDLSVTMTAVSTFSAFFMMPLWVFLLGEVIIADTQIVIPYFKITTYGVMLVVPLLIGVSVRRCLPKVADFMVKVMRPVSFLLIIFILVCGVWSQFFMIKLITWQIALVGFALPWFGFGFGCLLSQLCKRERKDILAIAIETGIQNTGMSIFMLWFTLDHPAGDLAAVVPVVSVRKHSKIAAHCSMG